jgi:uncharacterized protein YbcV (DUF1398 family)
MYIFAKFVADHIFLLNRDKINIKKFYKEVAGSEVKLPRQFVVLLSPAKIRCVWHNCDYGCVCGADFLVEVKAVLE